MEDTVEQKVWQYHKQLIDEAFRQWTYTFGKKATRRTDAHNAYIAACHEYDQGVKERIARVEAYREQQMTTFLERDDL